MMPTNSAPSIAQTAWLQWFAWFPGSLHSVGAWERGSNWSVSILTVTCCMPTGFDEQVCQFSLLLYGEQNV